MRTFYVNTPYDELALELEVQFISDSKKKMSYCAAFNEIWNNVYVALLFFARMFSSTDIG